MLEPGARLVWTVEASSHFEARTLYHEHLGWGALHDRLPGPRPTNVRGP
jgi:hypothetical protein